MCQARHMNDVRSFLVFILVYLFFLIFEIYVNTIENDENTFHETVKKDDVVESTVDDNNQYASFDFVLLENILDHFDKIFIRMLLVHVLEFNNNFMILSILVYKKDDYKQVKLTIRSRSTIQCEKNFCQMK